MGLENNVTSVLLETVCGPASTLPHNKRPEIALAGRSNVGKSSLINGLCNRKSYARTSSEPGKTQTINYYLVNEKLYLVDLPGYGYARVSKQDKEKWGAMIEKYLKTSGALKSVFLLLDIRRIPNEDDIQMYKWIEASGFEPVVIATKADKINRSKEKASLDGIRKALGIIDDGRIFPFSALSKKGRDEILRYILEIVKV
jgi:GTP-binding protein